MKVLKWLIKRNHQFKIFWIIENNFVTLNLLHLRHIDFNESNLKRGDFGGFVTRLGILSYYVLVFTYDIYIKYIFLVCDILRYKKDGRNMEKVLQRCDICQLPIYRNSSFCWGMPKSQTLTFGMELMLIELFLLGFLLVGRTKKYWCKKYNYSYHFTDSAAKLSFGTQ